MMNYDGSTPTYIADLKQLSDFFQMPIKQVMCIFRYCNNYYHSFSIHKKTGGTRTIDSPNYILKCVQRCILKNLLVKMPVSKYAMAYCPNKSLYDNAYPHCNKKYLLKIDLSNFFGTIKYEQVYDAAFSFKYFPKYIGKILTTLCCKDGVLPQGAPTSPVLSNLVMRKFDDYMGNWCEKRNISYTRYCDDIIFSGYTPLYNAFFKAKSRLEKIGFKLNDNKTHYITNANKQTVTGLTVNKKVSIPAEYKRKLRQEVYYVLKYGIKDSIAHSQNKDKITDVEKYYHKLLGKVSYVLQIEPDNKWFKTAFEDIKRLSM